MSKIAVFNFVSLDGFFAGPNGEIDWFKAIPRDDEFDSVTQRQSRAGGALIFGHTTYEMMKSYWPTPEAIASDPGMAEAVNQSPKIVFSKALRSAEEGPHWKNVRLFHEIKPEEITALKKREGRDFTILGSGSIVRQLANLGLIDEYNLVVVPVVLGSGKSMFEKVGKTNLKLFEARSFENGIVWLGYRPVP